MNKFTGIGRVIVDPSYRQVGGVDVCDIKVAVKTRGRGDDGYPKSIILRCTVWRKLAELARSFGLYKGQMVGVSGMLDMETYTAKDGTQRTNLTLDVDDIDFIRTAGDMPVKQDAPEQAAAPVSAPVVIPDGDVELPF